LQECETQEWKKREHTALMENAGVSRIERQPENRVAGVMEFGEAIKNPAYRILQTEYSGCLDISAHA